ncbi:hypothetical protein [Sinorhizobium alkalisoli]|uniref:Uncharacterized protein n=1 Tax=Sinorhizobium alkalisoli TaxID=1752398 RepID=A0A1E3V5S3_9HYPH|nr:hypothetical protein [Sinorhizobium alkalisoli]MCA1489545.1 hypothetical protein [Ensifer sp. NBAIM29]MCG5478144.1 hypothetical protein [Sinorhizobium alkalisoli]ODR88958.1 hypothetical protein A8M32_20975 [Sinorhizobium alkalisoli]QFI65334.1 hypothetical protein EKH55_0460 [Sinorhizobium alkalisoli]
MKPLATLVNAIAFTALFATYAGVEEVERPDGVRRALETYARALQPGASPLVKPTRPMENDDLL